MVFTPRLIVVVGSPGSGKDLLIRAVNDLGIRHAQIVPKHTSRRRRPDDGNEVICVDDSNYNIEPCDVLYASYKDSYRIDSSIIWKGLRMGVFQVVVVSQTQGINKLREIFGDLLVLVYVHSEISPDDFKKSELSDDEYVQSRTDDYRRAFDVYLKNFLAFDHVLIYSGIQEDLFDQIFRLFRVYEHGQL
jgi:guanylate kinase